MAIDPHYFKIFKNQNIVHSFSTRQGGFSSGTFESLNLGLSTKDKRSEVKKNREEYFSFLKIEEAQLVAAQQIHSDNISVVTAPGVIKETDALITNIPGLVLSIQTADCFPVFILDQKNRVCALVHSGWRGTAKNIVGKTINRMGNEFASLTQDLLIAIGAGIQQDNYQVDNKTAAFFEIKYLKEDSPGHFKLNIQENIIDQLLEKNISIDQMEIDNRCTFKDSIHFYSYRRDRLLSGRMMGLMGLL